MNPGDYINLLEGLVTEQGRQLDQADKHRRRLQAANTEEVERRRAAEAKVPDMLAWDSAGHEVESALAAERDQALARLAELRRVVLDQDEALRYGRDGLEASAAMEAQLKTERDEAREERYNLQQGIDSTIRRIEVHAPTARVEHGIWHATGELIDRLNEAAKAAERARKSLAASSQLLAQVEAERDEANVEAERYRKALVKEPAEQWHEMLAEAKGCKCANCGEPVDPLSSCWRWNGERWEHHHGYPLGHVAAVHDPLPDADEKEGE